MSEPNAGGTMSPPSGLGPPLATSGSAGEQTHYMSLQDAGISRWTGWIVFAASILILLGVFHAFQGLIALFRDEYYVVGKNGLALEIDYTAWGWTHLIFGLILVAVGLGLLSGNMLARVLGVGLAALSAIVNVAFLAAYPLWSTIMIAFDVLVIWALTVHGAEMKVGRRAG